MELVLPPPRLLLTSELGVQVSSEVVTNYCLLFPLELPCCQSTRLHTCSTCTCTCSNQRANKNELVNRQQTWTVLMYSIGVCTRDSSSGNRLEYLSLTNLWITSAEIELHVSVHVFSCLNGRKNNNSNLQLHKFVVWRRTVKAEN